MRWVIAVSLVILTVCFVAPAILILDAPLWGTETEETVSVLPYRPEAVDSGAATPREDGEIALLVLQEDGTCASMTMDEYLWRVVAAEMPASFEPAALCAQAVCARTYALWKTAAGTGHENGAICTDSACCQAFTTREEAAERWGENAQAYSEKIAAAVAETDGQVVTCGGSLIQAVYHSSSSGYTEDAVSVWGADVSYLTSVTTMEGEEVPNFETDVTYTAEEFRALTLGAFPQAALDGDAASFFGETARSAAGTVTELTVGGAAMTGAQARALYGLRSARFSVEAQGDSVTFHVTGYGHGVGLSQYGANALARQGSDWREILTWYYSGVEIENYRS